MNDIGNLPPWPGADTVYRRLIEISSQLARASYYAQRTRWKGSPKHFRFQPTEDMDRIREALNRGQEEECKGLWHEMRSRYGWPEDYKT